MKIAQVVCVFPPYRGGIGNSVYNMAKSLAALGHEIAVFTPDYNYQKEESAVNNPLAVREKPFVVKRLKPIFKIGNGAFLPQLFFKLKNFDIAHLHYPFYGAIKPILLRKILSGKKFKLIMHYHMDNRAPGIKGFIFYIYRGIVLKIMARLADSITCASLDYIKHSDLSGYYNYNPRKFKQISFGVDLEQFVIYKDLKNEKRENFSLLFVGGLDKAHYFKGLENLIKALAQLRKIDKYKTTVLEVVGQGDMKEYYERLAKGLGLSKAVNFNQSVDNDDLVDFYNNSDCLILPSINKSEAFGLVLLEAMACARPVITTNLPGVRSVFKNGRQGVLAKPDNINDLKRKIIYILENKERAEAMGQAGRELVEKKYTWEKVAKKLDVIYHRAKYT